VNQGEGPKLTRRRVDPDLTRQGSCVLVNRQDQKQNEKLQKHNGVNVIGICMDLSYKYELKLKGKMNQRIKLNQKFKLNSNQNKKQMNQEKYY